MVLVTAVLARSLSGSFLAFVLGALLFTTTPIGTGQGVHQGELLHPLFGHVHYVAGRLVTHETQPAVPLAPYSSAPAVAAGAASADGGLGLAIGPLLPSGGIGVSPESVGFVLPRGANLAAQFQDAPADPPPSARPAY